MINSDPLGRLDGEQFLVTVLQVDDFRPELEEPGQVGGDSEEEDEEVGDVACLGGDVPCKINYY